MKTELREAVGRADLAVVTATPLPTTGFGSRALEVRLTPAAATAVLTSQAIFRVGRNKLD